MLQRHLSKIIICLLLLFPLLASATNTKSVDFENSSGEDQYLSAAHSASLAITDDISIEAWVKFETLPSVKGDEASIVTKRAVSGGCAYFFMVNTDNKVQLAYYSSDSVYTTAIENTASITETGVWYHIAATADVSTRAITLYVNGEVSADTTTGTAVVIRSDISDGVVGISRDATVDRYYVDGKVDEVRIWSDVRTSTEISDNYNIETTDTGNLVAYWKLNDSLLDETDNNNDLTNHSSNYSTDVPFVGDTCTYSGTGNWTVNLGDNCYVKTNTYVSGNLILINNTGSGCLNVIDGAILSADSLQSTTTNPYLCIESDDKSQFNINNDRN